MSFASWLASLKGNNPRWGAVHDLIEELDDRFSGLVLSARMTTNKAAANSTNVAFTPDTKDKHFFNYCSYNTTSGAITLIKDGIYVVCASCQWDTTASGYFRLMVGASVGAVDYGRVTFLNTSASFASTSQIQSSIIIRSGSDVPIVVTARQSSGGSLDILAGAASYIQVFRVSA